jgi:hypothetical protein
VASEKNPGPVEVCRWRQPRKLGRQQAGDGTQTTTAQVTMPLTVDDLALIKGMIRQELASYYEKQQKTTPKKEYHTINDIRKLILKHIEEIREFVGITEFPIATIRAFLKPRMKLTSKDLELIARDRSDKTFRIDNQITNVFNSLPSWPDNPFISVRRGHYRLRPVASQLEI